MVPGSKPTTTQLWILSLNHLTTCSSPSVRWVRQVRYVRHSQNILTFFHRYCWEVSWWGSWRNFLPLSTWSTMKTFLTENHLMRKSSWRSVFQRYHICAILFMFFFLSLYLSFSLSISLSLCYNEDIFDRKPSNEKVTLKIIFYVVYSWLT